LLTDLLHILNTIWTQSDWVETRTYQLPGLFADDQFTRTVHSLVKSFEEELTGVEGFSSMSAHDSCTLPKLMLPLVLQVTTTKSFFC
jgi:hypothetical protein